MQMPKSLLFFFCLLPLLASGCNSGDSAPQSRNGAPDTEDAATETTKSGKATGPGTRSQDFIPDPDRKTTYKTREVSIPMRDGVVLKATEYVPDVDHKVPTVLQFYPYGRTANFSGGTTAYPASHGYAELVVDVRGTGGSGGEWTLFSPDEVKDYAEVVRWITTREYSDEQVVLYGRSYSAIAALHTLQQEGVEAVKAAFVNVPMGDAFRDLTSMGGAGNVGFLSWWTSVFVGGPSIAQPLLGDELDAVTSLEHATNFSTVTVPLYANVLVGEDSVLPPELTNSENRGFDSDFYRARSPLYNMDKIKTPVFFIGAQFDIFQRTQPMLFNALDLPPGQKKLLMISDYHIPSRDHWMSSNDGSRTVRDDAGNVIASEENLKLAWFDRWTRNTPNGITKMPTETYYFVGNDVAKAFPRGAPEVTPKRFYLQPDTPLSVSGPSGAGTLSGQFPDTLGALTMPFEPLSGACSRMPVQYLAGVVSEERACSEDNRVNEADAWNFTSDPVDDTVRIFGPGNLRLWIRSTAADAQVVAFLSDVAPDGTSTQVSFGQLIASHRELETTPCPTPTVIDCSVYVDGELIQPWHPHTQEAQTPLNSGQLYEINIEMFPAFIELKPGHRLRLSLKTGNFPVSLPQPPVIEAAAGGLTTVMSGPKNPSFLTLGIIP